MSTDGYLTVREAAERTGRNPALIRRWAREGKLPGAKPFGSTWMIATSDLPVIEAMPKRTRREIRADLADAEAMASRGPVATERDGLYVVTLDTETRELMAEAAEDAADFQAELDEATE